MQFLENVSNKKNDIIYFSIEHIFIIKALVFQRKWSIFMSNKLTYILFPTWQCNLNCLYCYASEKLDGASMCLETLDLVHKRIYENDQEYKKSRIIWHGGEPSLLGIRFFEYVINIQNKYSNHIFENSVQTNCAMKNTDILEFWIENGFKIGISYDGNKTVQSKTRIYHNGKSSNTRVMSNINYLQKRNIKFGLISVINSYSVNDPKGYYSSIRTIAPNSVRINPLVPIGNATRNVDIHISPIEYGEFLIAILNYWICEPQVSFIIEPLSDMLQSLITKKPRSCAFLNDCTNFFIGIDPYGNISPCGRLSKNDFYFGNIYNQSISDAIQSDASKNFRRYAAERLSQCYGCELLPICNGGCFSNTLLLDNLNSSISNKDYYCDSYRMLYNYMYQLLTKEKTISWNQKELT